MSSRELTGCNKRPSDRLEASWFPGGFLTGFSGDDLETEARRIGEIKEARLENPGVNLEFIHVPPDFQCVFPIWSRDLEKSLENEQKKLQEEKKRNEELQKDAKDGVEEPGGPHEADEKAQNCRCCLIAVMAEGKTCRWRMHKIMKLWNILVRHLWWSYKYHKDSLNISFQVDFGRTLKFLTYLDVFLSGCRGDSLWCCCRMVAAQWAGLPLSTLQHKCCCEKCGILKHFRSHSGRFESFGRWKCRTSGWADGPWSFRTFADFWQHVPCECFWERPDLLV